MEKLDVTQLNTLIIKKDMNNRLHTGMRCYKEGLVLDVKSMADREYGSLDIYGKVMSESDISLYNTNLSFDIKVNLRTSSFFLNSQTCSTKFNFSFKTLERTCPIVL